MPPGERAWLSVFQAILSLLSKDSVRRDNRSNNNSEVEPWGSGIKDVGFKRPLLRLSPLHPELLIRMSPKR